MRHLLRSFSKTARNTELFWRYGLNFTPSLSFVFGKKEPLNVVEREIVSRLDRDGIAISSIQELIGDRSDFQELCERTEQLLDDRRAEIETLQSNADRSDRVGSKTFNMELLGSNVVFHPTDVFARLALNNNVLNIANGYLRLSARLRYYNVWYTFATRTSARESQLWHFDREDNYILKVFLYLQDVDNGTGPFTYAPGTHRKGINWNRQPQYFLEDNVRRSTDDQMNAVIPQEEWITATGRKGTIVFADTRGFHKGGEARTRNRLMYTCMFTSPASDSKPLLRYPSSIDPRELTPRQLAALQSSLNLQSS